MTFYVLKISSIHYRSRERRLIYKKVIGIKYAVSRRLVKKTNLHQGATVDNTKLNYTEPNRGWTQCLCICRNH